MGIIGAGTWGEGHAAVYQDHPNAEAVAVCDLNEVRAKALAEKFAISNVYTDYKRMLAECDIDAVAVVTPDFLHAQIVIDCANAGKDMIIEKPLATTKEDVFAMMEAIERNGVRAMVDLHNRWNPPFNAVKQLVDTGSYGKAISAHFRLNDCVWVATDMLKWVAKSSILWFLGSHSLDTMIWIMGERPKTVYAVKHVGKLQSLGIQAPDSYMSTFTFPSGTIAQMENSWVTPNGNTNVNDFKFNLLCEHGKFDVDASSHNLLQVTNEEKMITQDILVQNKIFGKCAGFAYESIRSFIDKLVSGEEFHVTLKEAANISMAIFAVMESAETGKPVEIQYL